MSLLDLLIFLPILAALGIGLGLPARHTALGAAVGILALTIALVIGFDKGATGWQFAASRPLLDNPEISFSVGIDGMSLVLVILTALVTFCALWIQPTASANPRLWYISCLLIAAGALGAFVTTDVLVLYAFHELALIPTFLMIGLYGSGGRERRTEAAWKITLYLAFGSIVLLVGLVWLAMLRSPEGAITFNLTKLIAGGREIPAGTQANVFALLIVGFGILVSLFPFHSWAAPAYASAPTPVTMLHAGVLKKFGLYGILRVALPLLPLGAATPWVQNLLLILLLGNILVIGLVTIAQKQLDFLLGNSSVMHMGYVFLGIAAGNSLGYSGAVLLMFAHGIGIALLFALCRHISERTGTLELSRLGGLAKQAPTLGFLFGMAAMASIGLPGFANFAAEILIFFGGFKNWDPASCLMPSGSPVQFATMLALWGVVMSAVYMLRAFRNVFKGTPAPGVTYQDIPLTTADRIPLIILVAALLIIGFAPSLFLQWIEPITAQLPNLSK